MTSPPPRPVRRINFVLSPGNLITSSLAPVAPRSSNASKIDAVLNLMPLVEIASFFLSSLFRPRTNTSEVSWASVARIVGVIALGYWSDDVCAIKALSDT